MKFFKYIIIGIMATLTLGCDDSLNLSPISELDITDFYQSDDDFISAVNGVYATLRSGALSAGGAGGGQYGDPWLFGEIRSDNATPALISTREEINTYSEDSFNPALETTWVDTYEGIARANAILDRIDAFDFESASLGVQIKGETLFLRSLMYFNLVRVFGNIPLITETLSIDEFNAAAQASPEDVYTQIISDLTDAISLLPDTYSDADIGRVTMGAAQGVLARVYMTRGDYSDAETLLRAIIASSNYALLDDFQDVFDTSNEYNEEILFAVRWQTEAEGNGNSFMAALGLFECSPTDELYNAFDASDLRRDITISVGTLSNGGNELVKFPSVSDPSDAENDFPVIRYSDVLLMLAEAIVEQSYTTNIDEALTLQNTVRTRAGLTSLTTADVIDLDSFRLAMENERRFEFIGEGLRAFDLIRTDRLVEVINSNGLTISENDILLPIPQRVIDTHTNDIVQNP